MGVIFRVIVYVRVMGGIRFATMCFALAGCGGAVGAAGDGGSNDVTPPPIVDGSNVVGDGPAITDAPITDAPPPKPARCDPAKPFGSVTAVNAPVANAIRLSPDELTEYVSIGPPSLGQIASATRASTSVPFPPPMTVSFSSQSQSRAFATVSGDGRTMVYFDLMSGPGTYVATRPGPIGTFTTTALIPSITDTSSTAPYLVPDGSALWLTTGLPKRITRAVRSGQTWLAPASVPGLDQQGSYLDVAPVVTSDERTIYFGSTRPGSAVFDIWTATRATTSDPFGPAQIVTELSTPGFDTPSWISDDGCVITIIRGPLVDGGPNGTFGYFATRPL